MVLHPGNRERKETMALAGEEEKTCEKQGVWDLEVKTEKWKSERNERPSWSSGQADFPTGRERAPDVG